ncbi:MAG: DUF502 domain-containing protein [Haloarculaceae archaeon]
MLLLASPPTGRTDSGRGYLRRVLVTGAAIVVPVVLTIYVTMIIVDFLSQFLAPGVILVQDSLGFETVPVAAIQLVTALVFLGLIFVIGAAAESRHADGTVERRFESTVSRIPGIGAIYSNLNEISELLLEQDTDSFQEVKLVEFPQEESYMLGFVTAEQPSVMQEATGHDEMTTLFAPMGPNPFMGGFVLHLPEKRVHEIDMSVEAGIQTIVSSGVVINDPDELDDSPGDTA